MFNFAWFKFLKVKVHPRQRLKMLLSDVDLEVRLNDVIIGYVGAGSVSLLGKLQDLNPNCRFDIGRFCQANETSKISLGGEHAIEQHINNSLSGAPLLQYSLSGRANALKTKGRCVIGSGVIIGLNAVILSGANLGDGCIVGASAVCTNHYPAYSVVAGIPARVLKTRPPTAVASVVAYWDLKLKALLSVVEGQASLADVAEKGIRRSKAKVVLNLTIKDGKVVDQMVSGIKIGNIFFELEKLSANAQTIFKQVQTVSDEIILTNDFDELLYHEEMQLLR